MSSTSSIFQSPSQTQVNIDLKENLLIRYLFLKIGHFLPPIKSRENENNKRRLRSEFDIRYLIHKGFTTSEEILIENALQIVAKRLFKKEVLQNMYRICGKNGYFLAPGLWKRSNLSKHSVNHGKDFLLRYQLMCLKNRGEKGRFPVINIYPINENSEVAARGTFASICCISHNSTFSIDGEFHVKLNRNHLRASYERGLDEIEWAGIIVHEMLHNLGHNHGDHDYSDRWQMNIFKECFVCDGKYVPEDRSLMRFVDRISLCTDK